MPAEVEVRHTDKCTGGDDTRSKEHELHRACGGSARAGDHMPHGQFERAVVSSAPGSSTTSGASRAARMPDPHPARSSRNTTTATMNAIATVIRRAIARGTALTHQECRSSHQSEGAREQDAGPRSAEQHGQCTADERVADHAHTRP